MEPSYKNPPRNLPYILIHDTVANVNNFNIAKVSTALFEGIDIHALDINRTVNLLSSERPITTIFGVRVPDVYVVGQSWSKTTYKPESAIEDIGWIKENHPKTKIIAWQREKDLFLKSGADKFVEYNLTGDEDALIEAIRGCIKDTDRKSVV